jgi:hypothetical protein
MTCAAYTVCSTIFYLWVWSICKGVYSIYCTDYKITHASSWKWAATCDAGSDVMREDCQLLGVHRHRRAETRTNNYSQAGLDVWTASYLLFFVVEEQGPCEVDQFTCHRRRWTEQTKSDMGEVRTTSYLLFIVVEEQRLCESDELTCRRRRRTEDKNPAWDYCDAGSDVMREDRQLLHIHRRRRAETMWSRPVNLLSSQTNRTENDTAWDYSYAGLDVRTASYLPFFVVEEQGPCEVEQFTCCRHRRTEQRKILHGTTPMQDQTWGPPVTCCSSS